MTRVGRDHRVCCKPRRCPVSRKLCLVVDRGAKSWDFILNIFNPLKKETVGKHFVLDWDIYSALLLSPENTRISLFTPDTSSGKTVSICMGYR